MVEPGEEYLGWVIVSFNQQSSHITAQFKGALSTSVGTYLSTHKANLQAPKPVFGNKRLPQLSLKIIFRFSGIYFQLSKAGAVRFRKTSNKNRQSAR